MYKCDFIHCSQHLVCELQFTYLFVKHEDDSPRGPLAIDVSVRVSPVKSLPNLQPQLHLQNRQHAVQCASAGVTFIIFVQLSVLFRYIVDPFRLLYFCSICSRLLSGIQHDSSKANVSLSAFKIVFSGGLRHGCSHSPPKIYASQCANPRHLVRVVNSEGYIVRISHLRKPRGLYLY